MSPNSPQTPKGPTLTSSSKSAKIDSPAERPPETSEVSSPLTEVDVPAAAPVPPQKTAIEVLRHRFRDIIAGPPSRNKALKALWYGEAGVGKTTLVGSAQKVPSMKDLLVLDIESGSMSLADDPSIDTIQVTTYEKFARIYDWLKLYCKARETKNKAAMIQLEQIIKSGRPDYDPEYIAAHPKCYRSVAIDSLTEVQKLCMYQLLGIEVGTQPLDAEPDSAEFKQWGQASEMIRLLVRTYRSLPMNVFFVCAIASDQDEKKRYHYKPALPGKLADEIHGFVDVVGFVAARERVVDQTKTLERRVYLVPGETYQAKDRYHTGNKIKYLVNPTLKDFLEAEIPKEESSDISF